MDDMIELDDPRCEDTIRILCPQCGRIIEHLLTTDVECDSCDFSAEEDEIKWEEAEEKYHEWLVNFIEGGKRDG